jgi:hypothetical protein
LRILNELQTIKTVSVAPASPMAICQCFLCLSFSIYKLCCNKQFYCVLCRLWLLRGYCKVQLMLITF